MNSGEKVMNLGVFFMKNQNFLYNQNSFILNSMNPTTCEASADLPTLFGLRPKWLLLPPAGLLLPVGLLISVCLLFSAGLLLSGCRSVFPRDHTLHRPPMGEFYYKNFNRNRDIARSLRLKGEKELPAQGHRRVK
jgi:hypothetical protein